jgi:surface protein
MNFLFLNAATFNSDISNWNIGSVTSMLGMFNRVSSFNSNISRWDVSSVNYMTEMFAYASSFNSNISNWNIAQVTHMQGMFDGARGFHQNLCPWGSKLPSNFDYVNFAGSMFMFSGCANKNSPTGLTGPWCDVTTCTP